MNTPTPNTPLTAEDVTLLKGGDLCRDLTGQLYTVSGEANDKYVAPVQVVGGTPRLFMVLGDKFIGRPGPDGWIAAPEGGWTENPVPGQMVITRTRSATTPEPVKSEWIDWPIIIALRLASLSPAASEPGGERAKTMPLYRFYQDCSDDPRKRITVLEARDLIKAALSSSPSQERAPATPATEPGGERERIARLISPPAFYEKTPQHDTVYQCDSLPVAREKAFAKADAILAALSSSPPAQAGAVDWRTCSRAEYDAMPTFEPAHPSGLAGAVEVARKALEHARREGHSWMAPDLKKEIDQALAALAPTAGEGV